MIKPFYKLLKIHLADIFIFSASAGAYIYAYIVADRRDIFLYEHLGAGPFDRLTTGRYWMLGFVVAGLISLNYFVIMVLRIHLGRKHIHEVKNISIPTIMLLFTASLIISRLGQPPLPFLLALSTAFTLTFAVICGIDLMNNFITSWLPTFKHTVIAAGFIPFVQFFRVLELPYSGILSVKTAIIFVVSLYLLAVSWMLFFKWIFRNEVIRVIILLKIIIVGAWLISPVLHFFITILENHPYITASDNFFANNILLRFIHWAIIGITVVKLNAIRFHLGAKKLPS